jgi:hypothetical protein
MNSINTIVTKVDSPELAEFFAQFGKATYVCAEDINIIVANLKIALANSGMPLESNLGILQTTGTPPTTGKHKGDVISAGTYNNYKDIDGVSIVFTQSELDDNFAYIYVVNNVCSKILIEKRVGESAYQVALANGFEGTAADWLLSLKGTNGIDGAPGSNGNSAYQLALINGFVGTEAEWIASLKGVSKIPLWTATSFASGAQVVLDGRVYESNAAAVSTDIPGISSKWVERIVGIRDLGLDPNLDTIVTPGTYTFNRRVGTLAYASTVQKFTLIVSEKTKFQNPSTNREIHQQLIGEKTRIRKRSLAGVWSLFTEVDPDITNEYVKGIRGWNIVNPNSLVNFDVSMWNDSGNIIDGSGTLYRDIKVQSGVEYISKSGNLDIWAYDVNRLPLMKYPTGQLFTFATGTEFIAIRTNAAPVMLFGLNIAAKFDPFQLKIKSDDVMELDTLLPISKSVNVNNAVELQENNIKLIGGNYVLAKSGSKDYHVRALVTKSNIHNAVESQNIIVVNNGSTDVAKVEILNKLTSKGFSAPAINTELKLTVGAASKTINVTNIVNQLGGDDIFSIRRVDPAFTNYNFLNTGVYNEATEIANYTLPQSDLGWVLKVESTGLTLTRFDVSVLSDVVTIGTTALQTISVPFNASEKLDDYIRRLPALLGTGFEVKTQIQDITMLCADLIHCEIEMCRWFKPLKVINRRRDIAANDLSVFVVDAFPAQIQLRRVKPFEVALSYNVVTGTHRHQLFIDDLPVTFISNSTVPQYTGNQSVIINNTDFSVKSIMYNLAKAHVPVPIINFTGHKYLDRAEYTTTAQAATEANFRTTTGRISRVMQYMKELGFVQISINDFLLMKQGLLPWKKAYFWTMDDSSSIVTANGTFEQPSTNEKIRQMGMEINAGINTCSLDGTNGQFEETLTGADVNFFKEYAELFNHSYFHSDHSRLTALQMIYFLKKHHELIRQYALNVTRYFALPFDNGNYRTNRLIRSYGYPVVSAFFVDNYRGAIFRGSNDCCNTRISVDDIITWENIQIQISRVGLTADNY